LAVVVNIRFAPEKRIFVMAVVMSALDPLSDSCSAVKVEWKASCNQPPYPSFRLVGGGQIATAQLPAYVNAHKVAPEVRSMSLRRTIEVMAKLAEQGVIQQYAIAGAVAALNYIEPTLTEDLDILVSVADFEHKSGLILLTPIEKALAELGYDQRTDVGILVEDWPVQFLPVASALDEEALEKAIELEIDLTGPPLKARCLRAEHLVATAVKLGRLKDLARVQAFLERKAVDLRALKDVLERHHLMGNWLSFCTKAGIENPLKSS
jgi:hypothetical protein